MSLIVTKAAIWVASMRRCHVGRFGNGEFPDRVPRGRGSPLPAGPSLEAHADEGRVPGRVMPFWYVGSLLLTAWLAAATWGGHARIRRPAGRHHRDPSHRTDLAGRRPMRPTCIRRQRG